MQSLNIAEAGFGYIFKCIGAYYEGNIYFLLYLVSLLFLSFAGSRGRNGTGFREVFLPQFIMMAVTIYNPVFPVLINSFFDVNKEYYRFLWMSPVIICISAAGAAAVYDFACGEKCHGAVEASPERDGERDDADTAFFDNGHNACREKIRCKASAGGERGGLHKTKPAVREALAAVFIICLLIAGGTYLYRDGYIVSPNVYHMPSEIPEVANIIHDDASIRLYYDYEPDDGEDEAPTMGNDYPRAMFEYDYHMQIRQYDAGILLACDREQYLRAMSGEVTYETATEDGNYTDCLLATVALGIRIPKDDLISSLENTGTEYIVISTGNGMTSYYEDMGLEVVGKTANHTVLHYEDETPVRYSLPDYSEVWSLTPQWYDFLLGK